MTAMCRRPIVLAALSAAFLGTVAESVFAVSCGDAGATLKVVVKNPTGGSVSATVSGEAVSGVTTCTDAEDSYEESTGSFSDDEKVIIIPDLNSGLWVHHIEVSGSYMQHQKGMVLQAAIDPNDPNTPANPAKPFSEVEWTYFSHAYKVNIAGDANTGTCTTSCTFREAVTTVNGLTLSESSQALIYFTTDPGEPGAMDPNKPAEIEITEPFVTIDGTNSSGNPWIGGDTFGTQDPFNTVIDLNNAAHIEIENDNITIKGLEIKNSAGGGTPQSVLVEDLGEGTRFEATRLDGGAGAIEDCTGGCDGTLVSLNENGTVFVNVEAKNAYGSAVMGAAPIIMDSWLHHNLATGVETQSAEVIRSLVELSGFNGSDEVVNSEGDGLGGGASTLVHLETDGNVIRNNARYGISVSASSTTLSLNHDYLCGNDAEGALIHLVNSGSAPSGTGLTAAYNGGYGVEFTGLSGAAVFDDDSAFTANADIGLRNSSSGTISATNNQWRDVIGTCTGSNDISGSDVDCDPAQDYLDVSVSLDMLQPVFPTNVIRTGQAIRVQGTGFNAIDGNPLPDPNDPNPALDCTFGASTDDNFETDNCCRANAKANECDLATDPNDPRGEDGKGNCVVIRDRQGTWNATSPTSVTPTTIATAPPSSLACIGEHDEMIRVAKLNSVGGRREDQVAYCTNTTPK